MARCFKCPKDTMFGRKISITRSQVSRRALSKQKVNMRKVKINDNGTARTVHVCAKCLRSGLVTRS